MVVVIMGVSGSGKTTIGRLLAERRGWTFFDADDFHPEANVRKMKQGIPLTDEDRVPWLDRLNREVVLRETGAGGGTVLACSALRDIYRQRLSSGAAGRIRFVHLTGRPDLIRERMKSRSHFMPPALLESQLACLEVPAGALSLDIEATPGFIVDRIHAALEERPF